MKKTKRRALYIVAALLGALFVLSCLAGFAACGGGSKEDCADGHTLVKTDAVSATCVTAGNNAYWTCSVCNKVFSDETGTTETTVAAQTIPATGNHTLVKTDAVPASCTEAGNNAYWTCSVCNKVFSDEAGTTETTVTNQTIAALGHTLVKTEAKSATCTEAGNNAYWTCSECNKVFSDEFGMTETTVDDQTIAALGHELVGTYVPASTEGGTTIDAHWTYACSQCTETIDLVNDPVASLTLQATDEASLRAAGLWGEVTLSDVTPMIDVATTTENNGTITVSTDHIRIGGDTPMDKDIVLNADIDMTSYTIIVRCECVMDLNGHTISRGANGTATTGVVQVGSASTYGDLTLKDSAGTGKISGQYGVVINAATNNDNKVSTFTLVSGTIEGSEIAISTNGSSNFGAEFINIEGGMVSGGAAGIYLPSGSLTVTSGEISGATGIEIKAGSATISGGKISTTVEGGQTSVNKETNTTDTSGFSIAVIDGSDEGAYKAITSVSISGCDLSGSVYCDQSVENVVTIDSGVNADVVVGVSKADELTAAVANGGTVMLVGDIALSNTLEISATVTLDLNGHTLSANGDVITVTAGGSLIVMDGSVEGTGEIKCTYTVTGYSDNYAAIKNSGTLEINGGKIYGGLFAIENLTGGTLTVSGGTIGGARSEEDTTPYAALANWGEAYIYGGKLLGGNGGYTEYSDGLVIDNYSGKLVIGKEGGDGPEIVYERNTNSKWSENENGWEYCINIEAGEVIINGGTITCNADSENMSVAIYLIGGTLTVNGGTITANEASYYWGSTAIMVDYGSGVLTINDGTLSGTWAAVEILGGKVTVNGGTFDDSIIIYTEYWDGQGTLTFGEGVEAGFEKTMYNDSYDPTNNEAEAGYYEYTQKTATDDGGNTEPEDENP